MKKIFWTCTENGTFELHWEGKKILQAYAQAFHVDGRRMDSRYSRLTDKVEEGSRLKLTFERDDDLILTEELEVLENHVPVAKVSLSSSDGNEVEFSCEVSVEEIGDSGDLEGGDRKQAIERCFHCQAYDDKRNENDSYHRDGIGDVEEVAFNRRTEFWSCFFLCRIFSDPKGAESSRSLILLKIHRIDFRF